MELRPLLPGDPENVYATTGKKSPKVAIVNGQTTEISDTPTTRYKTLAQDKYS